MAGSKAIASAEALVADASGTTIAYECAGRYPCFQGASRAELKEIFERHGFPRAATTLDTTPEVAFGDAVARYGAATVRKHAKAGEVVLTQVQAEQGHARAYVVEHVERVEGERQPRRKPGARLFLSGDEVFAAPPIDAPELEVCAAVATEVAAIARHLVTTADTTAVSRAMTQAYSEAGAMPWIARGAYIAPVGRSGTDRLVALVTELRARYYDEKARCGLRLSAVPIKSGEKQSVQALVDAVLDDVSREVDDLVSQCRDESGRNNVRSSTLTRRRDQAQAILAKIAEFEGLMGAWAERFRRAATEVANAYNAAIDGKDLSLPEWAETYASEASDGEGEASFARSAMQDQVHATPPLEASPSAPIPIAEEDPFAL
jgi:hypothetical protein